MADATTIHLLGIAGSLRTGSYNRRLLANAQELLPEEATMETFDLAPIPLYDADLDNDEDRPGPVRELKAKIDEADGVLIVTPEYNYGIPGVLKNAIDWASRPGMRSVMARKPVGIMGASPGGSGTMRAQQVLKVALLGMIAQVFPHAEVAVAKCKEKFGDDGSLSDEATREFVESYLEDFVWWVRQVAPVREHFHGE